MTNRKAHAVLMLADPNSERLMRTALLAQGVAVRIAEQQIAPVDAVAVQLPSDSQSLLVIDPNRLWSQRMCLATFSAALRQRLPGVRIHIHLGDRFQPTTAARHWAAARGYVGVGGRLGLRTLADGIQPVYQALAEVYGLQADPSRIAPYARALNHGQEASDTADEAHHQCLAYLAARGLSAEALTEDLWSAGVEIVDRSYRLNTYKQCFVGDQAVSWLGQRLGCTRAEAVAMGQAMQACGLLYHVVREQAFQDGHYYYRLHRLGPRTRELELEAVARDMRGADGVEVRDRSWRLQRYPRCFVGSEAVAWLMRRYTIELAEAVALGQSLLEVHLLRHVVDEHDLLDAEFYYRFAEHHCTGSSNTT